MSDAFDTIAQSMSRERAASTIRAAETVRPDDAAKAARLGRAFGIPPAIAQADIPNLQQQQERTRAQAAITKHSTLSQWASDPSHAAMAQGDWANLSKTADTWTWGGEFARAGKRALATVSAGLWGALQATAELAADYSPTAYAQRKLFGSSMENAAAGLFKSQQKAGQAIVDANQTKVQNFVGRNLLMGLDSTVSTATGIGVGILTRNPEAALGVMGATTGGSEYAKARDKGLSTARAATYGVSQGLIEAATEKIPASRLLTDLAAKTPFAKTFFRQLASELPGEQVATLLQDLNEWAALNPEKPIMAYIEERPTAAAQTLLQTMSGTAAQTSAVKAADATARLVSKAIKPAQQAEQAMNEQAFLDRAMKDAAASNVQTIDKGAYSALVEKHSENTPAENSFIPAEKLHTLFQSADFDYRSDEFWGDYADQVDEGLVTGGDVVIPTAKVVAHLADSPFWDGIKDEVRLSPGGISPTEAAAFDKDMADHFDQLSDSVSAQIEADDAARAPRQKIADDIRNKLMSAGYRPSEATTNAELVATRYATRAERLGSELTGDETKALEVRQVLPQGLAKIVATAVDERIDAALKPVIAALRKNAAPRTAKTRFGPSLLDFIAKQGGMSDPGGELRSRDVGTVKGVSKKGSRKLINEAGPGADDILRNAVEAGYFPELEGVFNSDAEQTVDTRPLYDAIDNELRGTPRYSPANDKTSEADQIAEAATDLQRILDQADIDPATATDRQIAKAVEAYRVASQEGLRQGLFDDPKQPERSMTPEQRAELEARQKQGMARRGGQVGLGDQTGGLFSTERDQGALFQTYAEGPRGQITFGGASTAIELFEARDASTFIHEMGHNWLEELRFDAENNDAEQLTADWQTVQGWFASNGHAVQDGAIPTDAHELWARGFERFLMEGKAPSTGLRRVFESFKAWMLQIYKIADNLRAPITPEIREVMQRLVATDEEIATARQAQALEAGFTDAAQAGMSEAEFAAYKAAAKDARDEASDALLKRVMSTIRRERTKEWNDEAETVRGDVTETVNARPEFRALNILRTGTVDGSKGPSTKLDRAWLIETYGDGILGELPKQVPPVHADKGMEADVIAEIAGFASGDEMVRTLIAVEARRQAMKESGDKRSVRVALIEDEVKAVMRERYGDVLTDGSIEEEALAAVHNERQGELMATELRQLARQTNKRPTPYSIARDWARTKIASSLVKDSTSGAAIQQYARAAARAGKAFEEAILKQDRDEAFKQKQAQMLNSALVSEAGKAREQVEKAVERLGKIAKRKTIKSVDQDYLERAHDLMEQVEFDTRSQKSLDRQESFQEWAAARQAEGHDLVVPPSFGESLGTTNWSRLTVEKLLGLDEAVAQIIHLGRFKQKLIDAKEERDFNEVVNEAVAAASQLPPVPPKSNFLEPTFFDSIKKGVAAFDVALLKVETLVDWLDSGNANGVFNRVVFAPIAEAQARASDLGASIHAQLADALAAIPKPQLRKWSDRVLVPELIDPLTGEPGVFVRQKLISMALNMGNAGNAQRLADGYRWNEETILDVLNRELTADEWRYVQQVWDTIDTLWPETAAMERRINGVAPDKVEARSVSTPHGTFRGGYYPAVYDSTRDLKAEKNAARENDLFSAKYTKATTRASATKERAEAVNRPILLDLGIVNRHVSEVVHDITHREAVMNANKFLTSERVMRAMDSAIGSEARRQFQPWLKFVANQWANERAGNEGVGQFMGKLRTNTTVVGMGFRFSTIIMQAAGYSNSFEVVGAKWVSQAIAATAKNPVRSFDFVMERSGEVRHRMDTLDRDIASGVARLTGKANPLTEAKRFAFHGIGYMDRMVVIPTWLGAYNKALASGVEEDAAIYAADKAVRQSQGAGAAKDMAAVVRGTGKWGEAMKLTTMFYSYVSAVYQRQRTLGRDIKGATPRDIPALAARAWWLIVVPPLLSELIVGRGPEDDEDWGLWAFKKMLFQSLGAIPVVRDIAQPAYDALAGNRAFDYQLSPIQRAGQSIVEVGKDIHRVATGDETKKATQHALEAAGYWTGLVPGQVAQATQFLVDVGHGDADPKDASDWYEGLTTGKLKKDD